MEPVIKWIKKNVFWLGCAFLAIAMVATWFFASNSIADQTDKFQKDIKSNISKANQILKVTASGLDEGVIAHPNSKTEEGMKQELSKTIDAIVDAWRMRKRAQEKILVWPEVIRNNQGFVDKFGRFNPPETFPEKWEQGYGFEPELEFYRAEIPKQMIYLCGDEVLRANWKYDPANKAKGRTPTGLGDDSRNFNGYDLEPGIGAFGSRGGQSRGSGGLTGSEGGGDTWYDENDYAVIWSDVNQELWYQKLTVFQGRDDNNRETNAPTPLQCYMLQQDLWLLEAMFRIIREVNGNSPANDLSAIKRIDHVLFGREAGGKLGELTPPDLRLAGEPTDEDSPAMERDEMGGEVDYFEREMDQEPDSRGRMGLGTTASRVPYDDRYVDVDFEPLPADVVKEVITGSDLPEENLELIVAKRVPVRIALRMDETKIADFMAACANSPFAFEIQQVRWNKHTPGGESVPLGGSSQPSSSGRSGITGRTSGAGRMPSMNLGGRGGGGRSDLDNAMSDSEPVEIRTNYDVNVEFIGIVKIYNPVQEKLLRRAAGLEDKIIDPRDAADQNQDSRLRRHVVKQYNYHSAEFAADSFAANNELTGNEGVILNPN